MERRGASSAATTSYCPPTTPTACSPTISPCRSCSAPQAVGPSLPASGTLDRRAAIYEDHGFEINVSGWEHGRPAGGYFAPYVNLRLSDGEDGESLPLRLDAETARFIETHRNEPFFFLSLLLLGPRPDPDEQRSVAALPRSCYTVRLPAFEAAIYLRPQPAGTPGTGLPHLRRYDRSDGRHRRPGDGRARL